MKFFPLTFVIMRTTLLFIVCLLAAGTASGQQNPANSSSAQHPRPRPQTTAPAPPAPNVPQGLSGVWVGELLQNEGGIADEFEFSMQIQQNGIFMSGTSFVRHGKIYVEMKFSGFQLQNGAWKLTETEIVRGEKPEDLSWCMKIMELRLSYLPDGLVLHGPWWGNSAFGPCVPGSVRLKQKKGAV